MCQMIIYSVINTQNYIKKKHDYTNVTVDKTTFTAFV